MNSSAFQQQLLHWFDCHGRKDLPWQSTRADAYCIWVSEIMLQQTQVSVVIPYFQRFMQSFPSLHSLAEAPLDTVLEHWAGLGYYARARNLHKTAQIIDQQYNAQFPSQLESLCDLPGIGRSTAGAILSMAFSQPQAILDGNVKRVLTRFFGIEGWPGQSAINKQLWQLSEQVTPVERVADYTQAIMDLGATLCTRSKPICTGCPISADCVARLTERISQLPTPKKQQKIPTKYCCMLVLNHPQLGIYLEQRPPQGIWGGLWSLPEHSDKDSLIQWLNQLDISNPELEWLPSRKHTFSHFHLEFQPVLVAINNNLHQLNEAGQSGWYHPAQPSLALPAPIQKLMRELLG